MMGTWVKLLDSTTQNFVSGADLLSYEILDYLYWATHTGGIEGKYAGCSPLPAVPNPAPRHNFQDQLST